MNNTLLVARQELRITLGRPAYLFFALGIPVLAVVILAAVQWVQGRLAEGGGGSASGPAPFSMQGEGYVDHSGLIQVLPEDFPPGKLLAYATEAQARQALAVGEISAYYVIPADYLERGECFYVYPEDRALIEDGQDWVIARTLMLNLLGGDQQATDRVWNPIWNVETESLVPQPQEGAGGEDCSRPSSSCRSSYLIRMLPIFLTALFCMSFLVSGNLLLSSVGSEKENRTIEVVLLSIHPRQLLAGKTLALATAGLLQAAAWLVAIAVGSTLGGATLGLPEGFSFPPDLLAWGLIFFLGGYAIYASLMAGIGALTPNLKEAGSATSLAMMPLFVGYMVGLMASLAGRVDHPLPVALSLFPLTAPVVMMMRLAEGTAPLWQVLLSAGLTYASAWLALRAAAGLFNAHHLLSGQPFSLARFVGALRGARVTKGA